MLKQIGQVIGSQRGQNPSKTLGIHDISHSFDTVELKFYRWVIIYKVWAGIDFEANWSRGWVAKG